MMAFENTPKVNLSKIAGDEPLWKPGQPMRSIHRNIDIAAEPRLFTPEEINKLLHVDHIPKDKK